MTTRTFKQQGQGYGASPVNITASIDGVNVYTGTVSTIDAPYPAMPDLAFQPDADMFSWTSTVDYTGTFTMSITVNSGTLMVTDTLANYINVPYDSAPPAFLPGGADNYGVYYSTTEGGVTVYDPITNAQIDGQPVSITRGEFTGQWYYRVNAGSTFTCTVNAAVGVEAIPAWDNTQSYTANTAVSNSGTTYYTWTSVPSGANITDQNYWYALPLPVWNESTAYNTLDRVRYTLPDLPGEGIVVTASQSVPAGTLPTDTNYWTVFNWS